MLSRRPTLIVVVAALAAWWLTACSAAPAPTGGSNLAAPVAAQPTTLPAATQSADRPAPAEATTTPVAPTAAPTATPLAAIAAPTEPTVEPALAPTLAPTAGQELIARFPTAPTAAGEVILVTGQVLDLAGNPLPGAAVEFWQTDVNGVYDHPGDRGTGSRDRGFQFYGTAIADADGRYVFRTIQPGYYEPRPRHIHVKVKQDGRTLLTTQFYFEEDRQQLGGEGVAGRAGSLIDLLILREIDRVDMNGAAVAVLANDLIVNTGVAGALTPTPAQAEGPFYPVVSVAGFDNDLATVP